MITGVHDYLTLYRKIAQCRFQTWHRHRAIIRAFEPRPLVAAARLYILPLLILCGIALLATGGFRFLGAFLHERQARIHDKIVYPTSPERTSEILSEPIRETPSPAVSVPPQQLRPKILDDVRFALVANKATRSLSVYQCRPGSWKEIATYPIAIGRMPGNKEKAGDRKTPEGTYYIIGRRIWRPVSDTYGPVSYTLNYPNPEDTQAGKTGEGIWIHASANPDRASTRGCLGLSAGDLLGLNKILGVGIGTPVVITDSAEIGRPELLLDYDTLKLRQEMIIAEYTARLTSFSAFLEQWRAAWQNKDIEAYCSFYDTEGFFGQGMRWNAWRRSKEKTFRNYRFIEIVLADIVVAEYTDSLVTVELSQRYKSDALGSEDNKEIVLRKKGDEWKIFREEAFPKEKVL